MLLRIHCAVPTLSRAPDVGAHHPRAPRAGVMPRISGWMAIDKGDRNYAEIHQPTRDGDKVIRAGRRSKAGDDRIQGGMSCEHTNRRSAAMIRDGWTLVPSLRSASKSSGASVPAECRPYFKRRT